MQATSKKITLGRHRGRELIIQMLAIFTYC